MVFKDEALIYDLGCSTGQTIKYITKLGTSTNINIRGIDNSKTMIKLAKEKLKNINAKNINIELSVADVNKIQIEKCNLIYSILLMPFLSKKNQINLIEKSFKSLNKGGGFIFVTKVFFSKLFFFQDIFNQLYFDFKLSKKLSEEDILKKQNL